MTAIYRPCWILLFCFVLSGCFVMLWEQCVLLFDCVLCWINQFLVISAPPVLPGEHSEIAERGPCRRNCCSSRRWTDYITASFFSSGIWEIAELLSWNLMQNVMRPITDETLNGFSWNKLGVCPPTGTPCGWTHTRFSAPARIVSDKS